MKQLLTMVLIICAVAVLSACIIAPRHDHDHDRSHDSRDSGHSEKESDRDRH